MSVLLIHRNIAAGSRSGRGRMIRHKAMHHSFRLLSGLVAATALALCCQTGLADEKARSEAAAHLLQAELALQSSEYRQAATEYRKAAELSSNVDVARQATRVAYSFGFNDEALRAAKRWQELDDESDEALLYVAQLQLQDHPTYLVIERHSR